MENSVDLSQGELDRLLSQAKQHVPTERERLQAKIHEKFQGLVTQDHIDAMMSGKSTVESTAPSVNATKKTEYYGAISQDELDRLFKK